MSYGDADAGCGRCDSGTWSRSIWSASVDPSAMEPRSTIAEIDRKSELILHTQSQTRG